MANIIVHAGGDLQGAINSANSGDTIIIDAGATFVGSYKLYNKTFAQGGPPVTITSSNLSSLPAAGQRIRLSDAVNMPSIVTSGFNAPCLYTENFTHDYTIIGVRFAPQTQTTLGLDTLINFGDGHSKYDPQGPYQITLAQAPVNLTLDRCIVEAFDNQNIKRGIALNCGNCTVKNCYIHNIKSIGQDTQGISGWNGPGPFLIDNNFIEASSENIHWGSASNAIPDLIPSGFTITRNYFFKRLSWNQYDPSFVPPNIPGFPAGSLYDVKNLLEFKTGSNILVDSNVFENCWVQAQTGYFFLLTPRNVGGGPNVLPTVDGVTFSNNIIKHVAAGINIQGKDNLVPPDGESNNAKNITIYNNLIYDIGGANLGTAGYVFLLEQGGVRSSDIGIQNLTINHNTIDDAGSLGFMILGGQNNQNLTFTNNLIGRAYYGLHDSNLYAEGSATLNAEFTPYTFSRNVIWAGSGSYPGWQNGYPTNNGYPSSVDGVGFTDYINRDYHLVMSSSWKNYGTDGLDPGILFGMVPVTMINPAGIPTAQKFGAATLPAVVMTVTCTGIGTAQKFGSATCMGTGAGITVKPTGIPTPQAFGALVIPGPDKNVVPTGIPTHQAFGSGRVDFTILPAGLVDPQAFGLPAFSAAPATTTVQATGLPTRQAFGNATVSGGVITIQCTGLPTRQAFGNATVQIFSLAIVIQPKGIASRAKLGTPTINTIIVVATSKTWTVPSLNHTWKTPQFGSVAKNTLFKAPAEIRYFTFDFSGIDEIKLNKYTLTSAIMIIPLPLLSVSTIRILGGSQVQVQLKGGTANSIYNITCQAYLSNGSVVIAIGQLFVDSFYQLVANTHFKLPAEIRLFEFDFSNTPEIVNLDNITSVTMSQFFDATGMASTDLTITSANIVMNTVQFILSGGQPDTTYDIVCLAELQPSNSFVQANGRLFVDTAYPS